MQQINHLTHNAANLNKDESKTRKRLQTHRLYLYYCCIMTEIKKYFMSKRDATEDIELFWVLIPCNLSEENESLTSINIPSEKMFHHSYIHPFMLFELNLRREISCPIYVKPPGQFNFLSSVLRHI